MGPQDRPEGCHAGQKVSYRLYSFLPEPLKVIEKIFPPKSFSETIYHNDIKRKTYLLV